MSRLAETPADKRHPLVSRVLETDGLDVFTEHYGQLINLSRAGQAVMREIIDGALKRIERDHGGIPIKLYPFTRHSIKNAKTQYIHLQKRIQRTRHQLMNTKSSPILLYDFCP